MIAGFAIFCYNEAGNDVLTQEIIMNKKFDAWAEMSSDQLNDALSHWVSCHTRYGEDPQHTDLSLHQISIQEQFKSERTNVLLAQLLHHMGQSHPQLFERILRGFFTTNRNQPYYGIENLNNLKRGFYDMSKTQRTQHVLRHAFAFIYAEEHWEMLPLYLNVFYDLLHTNNSSDLKHFAARSIVPTLSTLSSYLMKSPQKVQEMSAHFAPNHQRVVLPFCLAQDPYNLPYLEHLWNMNATPAVIGETWMVATKGLEDLDALKNLSVLQRPLSISNLFEALLNSPLTLTAPFRKFTNLVTATENNEAPALWRRWFDLHKNNVTDIITVLEACDPTLSAHDPLTQQVVGFLRNHTPDAEDLFNRLQHQRVVSVMPSAPCSPQRKI